MRQDKKITDPAKMPDDFWNYLVNPIVGFYIEKTEEQSKGMERKYAKQPQGL